MKCKGRRDSNGRIFIHQKFKKMKWKTIMMLALSLLVIEASFALAKKKKVVVSGYVLDVANNPIKGASIIVENTKSTTFTNKKGYFKMRIDPDTKNLIAFSVNHGAIEVAYTGLENVNFVFFATDNTEAQEISNQLCSTIDLASTRKINECEIHEVNYSNIYEMIASRLPGVVVRGNSITIRGPSSINDQHNPLFVVDGHETYDIDFLIPRNVKSISVIHSSAAAIYGNRGAMGVIVIELKK